MEIDFTKTSIEYNEGFIDGLMWVVKSGNKAELNEILSMVENISSSNNKIMEEEYERIGRLEIK